MNEFEQIMHDGVLSEAILKDETFVNAVTKAEQRIIDEWRQGKTTEEREQCHYRLKALISILTELKIPVMNRDRVLSDLNQLNGQE